MLASWIAAQTGATVGYLGEAANSVGAQLVNALPGAGGLNAAQMLTQPMKALLLLNTEPVLDAAIHRVFNYGLPGCDESNTRACQFDPDFAPLPVHYRVRYDDLGNPVMEFADDFELVDLLQATEAGAEGEQPGADSALRLLRTLLPEGEPLSPYALAQAGVYRGTGWLAVRPQKLTGQTSPESACTVFQAVLVFLSEEAATAALNAQRADWQRAVDGAANDADNCPNVSNPEQLDADGPVLLRREGQDLVFAIDDEAQGDALDAAGARRLAHLALNEPGQGEADQPVEDAARPRLRPTHLFREHV